MENLSKLLSKKVLPIYYPDVDILFSKFVENNKDFFVKPGINDYDKTLYNMPFINLWKDFVGESIDGLENYNFFYPTLTSYDAIKDTIVFLSIMKKTLVCFKGENEVYTSLARIMNMPILEIDRNKWQEGISQLSSKHVFFTSEPSFIDGNFFNDFDLLLKKLSKNKVDVYLDVSYIGATSYIKKIVLKNNVKGLFFNLDYSLGLNDHKISGLLSKEENPFLFNNLFSANSYSLKYGIEVLNAQTSLLSYPDKIKNEQLKAINFLEENFNIKLKASDMVLMATVEDPGEYENILLKLSANRVEKKIVICLSKIITTLIRENDERSGATRKDL